MDTPFRSSPRIVQPEWIDFNGHLNMAYYSVLMDNAEFHICYLRELHEGASTYCTFQLLDFDEKRFHSFTQLWHEDGWLAATGEALTLHIDQSGPRVAPMPADLMARLEAMKTAHASLPYPEQAGRKIGLKR